jgi:dihydrolipoamide dehydrogenase
VSFDLAKIVERSRKVAGQLNMGVKGLMKKNKVDGRRGRRSDHRQGQAQVDKDGAKTRAAAKHIIIATGARARDLPFRQGRRRTDLDLSPRHGAAGDADQIAGDRLGRDRGRVRQLLFDMGAEVTVVEMLDPDPPVEV